MTAVPASAEPTADPQTHVIVEDSVLNGSMTFTDPDGATTIRGISWSQGDHGWVDTSFGTETPDGRTVNFTYNPDANWYGTDQFTIAVHDWDDDIPGALDPVTVTVHVLPVEEGYHAEDDTFAGDEDTVITGNVLDNDFDPDGDVFVTGTASPSNGDLAFSADGSFTYTPDPNWHGTTTFTYSGTDGLHFADATVTLRVNSVNDPAQFVGTHPTILEDDSITATFDAADVDGLVGSAVIVDNGDLGSATIEGFTPGIPAEVEYRYEPFPDENGTDEVTFRVTDSSGGVTDHTETITVTPVNDAPVADDDSYTGNQDTPIDVTLTATDVDGDTLNYVPTFDPPDHGDVIGSDGLGTFTYTPDPGFSGTDSLTFEVQDGHGGVDTGTVTFAINGTPLVDDITLDATEDTPLAVDVHDVAADPDHGDDQLTYAIVTSPASGSLVDDTPGDANDGAFTYTPNPDIDGTDSFEIEACDPGGLCDSGTMTVDVAPVNDAPSVDDLAATVDEDGTVTGDIPVIDVDNTADDFTYIISTEPEHGTATPGSFTYTPDADFHGTDTFDVTVCDPGGACDTSTIDVTIAPVNDAPSGSDEAVEATAGDTVTLSSPFTDVDDDPLALSWTQTAGRAVQLTGADGPTPAFTPTQSGTFTFTVTACDPDDACTTRTINVDVDSAPIRVAGLPITGTSVTGIAVGGLALVGVGATLSRHGRRRTARGRPGPAA